MAPPAQPPKCSWSYWTIYEPQPAPIVVAAQPLARLGAWPGCGTGCEMKRFMVSFQGDLYLAAIKDLWNREIGSYAISHRTTQDLPGRAPLGAVTAKRTPAGLIHHSDRGSQYGSLSYQVLLKQFGMLSSMCRKGTSYDNAPMENFFGTLKCELVRHRKYHTRQEAMAEIFESLECILQLSERHASLGNLFTIDIGEEIFQPARGRLANIWCALLRTDLKQPQQR